MPCDLPGALRPPPNPLHPAGPSPRCPCDGPRRCLSCWPQIDFVASGPGSETAPALAWPSLGLSLGQSALFLSKHAHSVHSPYLRQHPTLLLTREACSRRPGTPSAQEPAPCLLCPDNLPATVAAPRSSSSGVTPRCAGPRWLPLPGLLHSSRPAAA